ncbi:AAEL010110-PA [Aedes aegypti]|uniref:AAEL010110-PA n=1 Tax=Aedes aegypti TaxID=7159 RepID=Q16TW9_AEDAE|nr:AAEL010110-PA [Aedes aegypti]
MATPMANGVPSEDYCRCCLTEATDLLFDVFSILEESKGPICELIATLCGIIISEKDGESKNICGDCLRDLVTTYRFRERCLRVNRILKVKSFGGVWVVPSVVKRDPEWDTGMLAKATQYVLPKSDKESQTEKVAVKDDKQQMKTFGCYECRSKFTGKSQLMNHIRIHKCPFQCNVCFRRFKLSGDLMLHRSSHHGSDAYGRVTLKLN